MRKLIILLLISSVACTEKFHPQINEDASILVVDGKITNLGEQAVVRIFRTVNLIEDYDLNPEVNALVTLHDNFGNVDIMYEVKPGFYTNTDHTINGESGNSYWIKIVTSDGEEYESSPEIMPEAFEIESVYGIEEERIIDANNKEKGVKLYFDAKSDLENANYLKWEYKESYEWRSPENLNTKKFTENPAKICYPVVKYNNINLFDASNTKPKKATQLSTTFITLDEVKLQYQYLIDINLYSVTSENYHFWNQIKATNASNGDIYDTTPANIGGNIVSCNDCKAIGYFEASAVNTYQKIFSADDFSLKFSDYPEECKTFEMRMEDDVPDPNVFHILSSKVDNRAIIYTVRRIECYECNKIYSPNKPSFWPDNE